MADVVRMNLNVDPEIPTMLAELAGGNKRMGAYLSNLIRSAHAGQESAGRPGDTEVLANAVAHLSAKVKEIDGRLLQLEGKAQ